MVLIRSVLVASAAVTLATPAFAAPANGGNELVSRDIGDMVGNALGLNNGDDQGGDQQDESLGDKIKDWWDKGVKDFTDGVSNLFGGNKDDGDSNPDAGSDLTNGTADNSTLSTNGTDSSDVPAARNGPVLITGGWDPVSGKVPYRREIRDMMKDKASFSLYLLALKAIQENPDTEDPLSCLQLSSIHGEPYNRNWNGDAPKSTSVGYCAHNNDQFPVWHRPYLLAYEQALYVQVQKICKKWPSSAPDYQDVTSKCITWRMPYWDWATKNYDPVMPDEIATMETIHCSTPDGPQEIENPLYRFRFPKGAEEFMGDTMKWFPDAASIRNYPELINTALRSQRQSLQSEILKLYSNKQQSWAAFATKTSKSSGSHVDNNAFGKGNWANTFSVEFIHDQVHGYVGTNGNSMASPSVAAFDPVFWLHHCFVDKLFADWQAYTGNYAPNLNTPLIPFRRADGEYYTNGDVQSIQKLGYTYPSIGGSAPSSGSSGSSSDDNTKTETDGFDGKSAETIRQNYPSWLDSIQNPTGDLKSSIEKIVKDNKYYEYSAAIEIDTSKYQGPVDVYAYLGDGDPSTTHDINNAVYDPEFCGKYTTFSWTHNGMDGIIEAGIPLTGALLKSISKNQLSNMLSSGTVQSYLEKHFEYVVVDTASGSVVDPAGCQVDIVHTEVTLPGKKTEIPTWQPPKQVFQPKPAPPKKFVAHSNPKPESYQPAPAPQPQTSGTATSSEPASTATATGYAPPPAPPAGSGASAPDASSSPSATALPPTNSGFTTSVPHITVLVSTLALSFFLL